MTNALRERLKDAPPLRKVADAFGRIDRAGAGAPVTRFAPSPTGELHLGHVVHALWVWGVAEAVGAKVLVRIEDHDQTRATPEFEASILADLAWLGFEPEPVSLASLQEHPSKFRQSDNLARYAGAFRQLAQETQVYSCTCTRALLGAADQHGERRYPGTCRGMSLVCEARHVIRAKLPAGEVRCHDLLRGVLVQNPQETQGDVVVRDAMEQWTYQLCVVVDDMQQGVNLVVRGEDLLPSTGRQLLLARLLGRAMPLLTVHHPLVLAADGQKLSKRDRSETVRSMRESGMSAEQVIAAAWRVAGLD